MAFEILNIDFLFVGISVAGTLIMGSVVFLSNSRSVTNKVFFAFSTAATLWGILNYASYQSESAVFVLWAFRFVVFSAVWYSFFLFLLAYVFPKESIVFPKWHKYFLIPIVVVTALVNLSPLVFPGMAEVPSQGKVAKTVVGPGIYLFIITVIGLIGGGIYLLIKKFRNATGTDRSRIRLILIGLATTFCLHAVFNLILPAIFLNVSFIPFGAAFTLPFIAFTAYAIIKYRLLNVKVIATELLTFAVWLVVLVDFLASKSVSDRLFEGALLIFIVVFGILLIRSVRKEVEQREYLEVITKELENANEKLKALDDLKTDFISIASHQLRTPLTAIKGYTSMIMEGSYGEVSDKVKETIGKVFQSAQRLIYIVNDLLDISRIEQGRFTIALEPIKVVNVLKDVVEELQQNAKTKNLSLELAVAQANMDVTASADFNKIRQVFLNVIDNAIKYTNEGYVRVSVERRASDVLVSVKDSGLGISDASMKNLFQKFSRAKGVTKLHTDGSGLGLFIVKKIMEAHGGNVWAESEGEGKGSQFYVSIPFVVAQATAK